MIEFALNNGPLIEAGILIGAVAIIAAAIITTNKNV